jgi:hypothetical protein
VEGIPVTTPARTLIDLADVLTRRGLERAVDEAGYLRLDLKGLRPIAGRRGAGVLAGVLSRPVAGSTRTRSELEESSSRSAPATSSPSPRRTRT